MNKIKIYNKINGSDVKEAILVQDILKWIEKIDTLPLDTDVDDILGELKMEVTK